MRSGALVQERFSSERGENLAAAISMRAFLALFPIVLLAIAAAGFAGGNPKVVSRDVADALGLGRDFGSTLSGSLTTAREGRGASSLVGVLSSDESWSTSRFWNESVGNESVGAGALRAEALDRPAVRRQ